MRTVATLWRSTHPGPTVVVTAIALALGAAAGLDPPRLVALTVAVLLGQVSIGLSNDVIDVDRDRTVGRTDKPLAQPGAPVRAAWIAAIVSAAAALAVSAALGWGMALAHAVFLACGWLYNAGLKSTVWSAACFVVGFGVFPSLAPLSLPAPQVAPVWAWIAGAALGAAVHFSNVLPDLDDDARTGVRGLPHRWGRRASAMVAAASLVVGGVAGVAGPALQNGEPPGILIWALAAAILVVAAAAAAFAVSPRGGRWPFRLVMLAALLLAVQLVVSGWVRG